MHDRVRRPGVDWAAVQLDYEQHRGNLAEICQRYGITEAQLRHRRERHGWALRNDWSLRISPLINRMMRALDGQVRQLEQAGSEALDRHVPLLGTMTKALEKLVQLDDAERAKRPAKQREHSDTRNMLVERIEHLKRD